MRIRKENEIRRNEKTTPERGMWKSLYKKESRRRKANKEIQGRKKLKREKKTKRARERGRGETERQNGQGKNKDEYVISSKQL